MEEARTSSEGLSTSSPKPKEMAALFLLPQIRRRVAPTVIETRIGLSINEQDAVQGGGKDCLTWKRLAEGDTDGCDLTSDFQDILSGQGRI
jgi:hypothetical protein